MGSELLRTAGHSNVYVHLNADDPQGPWHKIQASRVTIPAFEGYAALESRGLYNAIVQITRLDVYEGSTKGPVLSETGGR